MQEALVGDYAGARIRLGDDLDAVAHGETVLVVDDLIATGGTALATLNLLRQAGAEIVGCSFVVDLPDLGGRRRLEREGVSVLTLVEFEGE